MKDSYAAKFFLLMFILSWGAWALLVRLAPAGLDPASPSYLLFMLGGFGPTLVGVFLTAANEGRSGLGDLLPNSAQRKIARCPPWIGENRLGTLCQATQKAFSIINHQS